MKEKDILNKISKKSLNKEKKRSIKSTRLLNKRYFLEEEVGRGGLSIVYKAKDIYSEYFNEQSNIVIKIPMKSLLKKKDIAAFVYAEYTFLRKLNNNNIIKVLDFGIDKKTSIPYIVLEYIKGPLLSKLSIVEMDIRFKNKIFKSLFNTLKYIHSQNIIHADITPSNIIINKKDPILFDFGISQNIKDNKNLCLEYKKVKAFNPKYCAPEVLEGEKPTVQSDIFSLACVMYEIFTCKSLFKSNSLELKNESFSKINTNKIPLLLKPWFKSALHINPKKRFLKITFFELINNKIRI